MQLLSHNLSQTLLLKTPRLGPSTMNANNALAQLVNEITNQENAMRSIAVHLHAQAADTTANANHLRQAGLAVNALAAAPLPT